MKFTVQPSVDKKAWDACQWTSGGTLIFGVRCDTEEEAIKTVEEWQADRCNPKDVVEIGGTK